jgi:hypothetical protein
MFLTPSDDPTETQLVQYEPDCLDEYVFAGACRSKLDDIVVVSHRRIRQKIRRQHRDCRNLGNDIRQIVCVVFRDTASLWLGNHTDTLLLAHSVSVFLPLQFEYIDSTPLTTLRNRIGWYNTKIRNLRHN